MLRIEDADRVRLLTLDRPQALNAFNVPLYEAVRDALSAAAEDGDIAVVVVTGAGRAFSAGQDIGEMAAGPGREPGGMPRGFPAFMNVLQEFPKPIVAAVNGLAVGIGLTMLLHCDLVLVADEARLRAPFVSLGVVPEAASSALLPLVAGNQAAAHAFFTASWISAEQAVAAGIAWRQVPGPQLVDEALAVAREIAVMPVSSLVATKQLVLATRIDAVRAARAREDEAFARMIGAPANREAIAAFTEKRTPDFRGM